jgi:hypothetical protein
MRILRTLALAAGIALATTGVQAQDTAAVEEQSIDQLQTAMAHGSSSEEITRAADGHSAKTMQIVAADGAATFPTKPDGNGRLRASDFVTDTFLTQVLAEATGRIGVKLDNGPTLAMPADPVIGQTIRRCAAP